MVCGFDLTQFDCLCLEHHPVNNRNQISSTGTRCTPISGRSLCRSWAAAPPGCAISESSSISTSKEKRKRREKEKTEDPPSRPCSISLDITITVCGKAQEGTKQHCQHMFMACGKRPVITNSYTSGREKVRFLTECRRAVAHSMNKYPHYIINEIVT